MIETTSESEDEKDGMSFRCASLSLSLRNSLHKRLSKNWSKLFDVHVNKVALLTA